jgi:hypothetical protein
VKKDEILNAIMNKKYANHELTEWAENMFFNYIGGEYFNYPADERKYNEQFLLIKELRALAGSGKNKQAYKKAVKYIIYNFCSAVTQEFDCSYSYAQKVIVKAFGKANLEVINNDLISKLFNYSLYPSICDIALNQNKIVIKSYKK